MNIYKFPQYEHLVLFFQRNTALGVSPSAVLTCTSNKFSSLFYLLTVHIGFTLTKGQIYCISLQEQSARISQFNCYYVY